MIVIDPRVSETAAMADFHLQTRPGTDAWCLAALAAILVQEDLVAKRWLAEHTTGFEQVEPVLRRIDVARYAHLAVIGILVQTVYFGLAYIYLETKRHESGLDYARKALHLIETSRAFQLFLDQGFRSQIVTEALIRAGERSTFLERVLENLPEKQNGQVAVQNNSYSIQVQCFGNFRVVMNGEEVSQERWVSAKARHLLAYFVKLRGEKIPADKVFDAIWGDKERTSRTAFHTALSRLRNALKAGDDSPRLILVEVENTGWTRRASPLMLMNSIPRWQRQELQQMPKSARNGMNVLFLYIAENICKTYITNGFFPNVADWHNPICALEELASYHLANQTPKQAVGYIEKQDGRV